MSDQPKSVNVLLLGPPGAGKGTQAQWLAESFNLSKIDTGNLIRQAIKDGNELGKKAIEFVQQGKLIPDNLVISLILDELVKVKVEGRKFLLDGFPRNIAQAQALDEALKEQKMTLDSVISIKLDPQKLLERITGRRICSNKACGAVYHTLFSPPKTTNICDKCSSPLYQRDDDKAELVESRLQTYHQETAPLITFYQAKGILSSVDGNGKTEEVSAQIEKVLSVD